MSRLKGLKMKFFIGENNHDLFAAIQQRVFDLGGRWRDTGTKFESIGYFDKWVLLSNGIMSYGSEDSEYETVLLDYLYHLPEAHTITIDGKEITLSEESFNELKKELCDV